MHIDELPPTYKNQPIWKSFLGAFRGIGHAMAGRNFYIQIIIGLIVIILTFILELYWFEKLFIIVLVSLVLGVELLNTAIEGVLDFMAKTHNPEVGRIKEMTAGAVLIFSVTALIAGVWIFGRALFL
ncbi:diacylglycerol kinase [Candidatus Peregrinibacteria bacterium]|nr:diacylglycerol kinase [Candidatus Peregrinibacteria bacterium]MBI5732860.1 diacylglycerol kinase [Candidatus Jorgensenbacteria bacterium]